MTSGGEIYLAIILAAFVTYAATLFWAMITTGGYGATTDERKRPHA